MLTISDLSVRYGRSVKALHGVTVEVPEQTIVAVLGSNGAGKSTLLRAISGTLPMHRGEITAGTIELDGTRIDRMDPASIVRRRLGQVPENRQIFSRMTVEENLRAGALAATPSRRGAARDDVLDLFPKLAERLTQPAGLLSGGEQQMLAIGRAMMAEPKVLLLDEPSLGLAPQIIERIGRVVTEINQRGTTVLLVEQNAMMALTVAHTAVVLEVGELKLRGDADELKRSEDIQRLYLGGHAESREHAEAMRDEALGNEGRRRTLGVWS